jgi:hypothetical protein
VLEFDRAVLLNRVEAAKAAIHRRIVEIRTTSELIDEYSRLEDSLKILDGLTRMYA